ncbi:hypothetical protein [Janibacter sp. G1551]|uniref:hypothetical protein n=1 Tax=Janibacter sp. G1551 TaxID=3420440 RepID=UPI003D0478DF
MVLFTAVNVTNVPERARYTARRLQIDAKDCDKAALVWRATRDHTSLSYGLVTPGQAFALPDAESGRYWYQAQALTTLPGTSHGQWADYKVWPRVATAWHAKSDSAWAEVVRAGLLTQAEADRMRRDGSGYMGWRIGVSEGGKWMFAIAGD